MNDQPHREAFNSAVRWLTASSLLAQALSWLSTIFVMRELNASDYGLMAMISTTTVLVVLFAEFGFGPAIIRLKDVTEEELSSAYGASILLGFGSALAINAVAPYVALFYREPQLELLLRVASVNFLILPLGMTQDSLIRRTNDFRSIAIIGFAASLTGSVSTYTFAILGFEIWALVYGQILSTAVCVALQQVLSPVSLEPSFNLRRVASIASFGGTLLASRLTSYFSSQSDLLIGGKFLGKESIGVYVVALDIAALPLGKLMAIVNQAALPTLARMSHAGTGNQAKALLGALTILCYVVFPALWGIAAISDWLIPVLIGDKWTPAVMVLQLICLMLPAKAINALMSTTMTSFGRADIELRNSLVNAIIFVLSFAVGVRYGLIGMGLAWCVALPLSVGLNIRPVVVVLGMSLTHVLKAVAKPTLISLSMAGIVHMTGVTILSSACTFGDVLLLCGEGVVLYLGMLYVLDRSALFSILNTVRPSNA